jgi:hypothetical protein
MSLTSSLSTRCPLLLTFASWLRAPLLSPAARFAPTAMAPPQPILVLDPLPWNRSMVTEFALHELVNGSQLAPNVEGSPPAWIVPPATDREPNPPYGYVVSFIRHHERGFAAPVSRFMRGLCHHYGVELHNFAPTRFRRWPPSSASARGS